MSRADAVVMNDASGALDAGRAAIGLVVVIALFVVAALSLAAHADEQTAADEIAQLGD